MIERGTSTYLHSGVRDSRRQNKPVVMEAGQYLLPGMGAERRTGRRKALDLEEGLAHTGVCTCPRSSDCKENLCVSVYVNFT